MKQSFVPAWRAPVGCNRGGGRRARSARAVHAAAIIVALFATTASATPAAADLRLCNATSSRIGVAIGYRDSKGWATEGWWNIASQTCELLLKGKLTSRYYYVHAVDYDRGGEWAGNIVMCTSDKAFTIRGSEDCQRRGHKQAGFFEVDTKDASEWTIRLTDPGEGGAKPK